jgi:hypothetical protein
MLLAICGFLLVAAYVLPFRSFDPDEFEHSHAAWCMSKGMLPYRDFFEHHTPWYYYLLRPFFHAFDVAGSLESARHFFLFGRVLSLALTALSVFLVARIGHLWQDRKTGVLAALLLVSQPVFFEKAIEMRPDVLALPMFAGCLWLLLRATARDSIQATKGLRYFVGAGLGLGGAVMCTQKMLFVLPGLLAGLCIWSLAGERSGRSVAGFLHTVGACARFRVPMVLAFLGSACIPAGLTWAGFALQDAGTEFLTNNFLLNARWKPIQTHQLHKLISTSWPVLSLCLLGVAMSLFHILRWGGRWRSGLLLFCTLSGLFAGVVIIPSAHSQYYLMPLPLVCLFAAKALSSLVERAHRPVRPLLLLLALIPLGVLPARALRATLHWGNEPQLARLGFVFENTAPGDIVMDGWQGTGVFRPHAFHYFFLHPETLAMLPRSQLDKYLNALERGRIRPRLIAMDPCLFALGQRFHRFVLRNYTTRDGFFYVRNGFWRPQPGSLLRQLRGS